MIRLRSLELLRFKNIEYGRLDFPDLPSGGSITGIYGQNGSGKTAVINAADCINRLICGSAQAENSCDYLESGAEDLEIKAAYHIEIPKSDPPVDADMMYEVRLARGERDALRPISEVFAMRDSGGRRRVLLSHTAQLHPADERDSMLFDGEAPGPRVTWEYGPKGRWRSIMGSSDEVERLCMRAEGASWEQGTSFIFSRDFRNALATFISSCMLPVEARQDGNTARDDIPKSIKTALDDCVMPLHTLCTAMKRHSRAKVYILPTAQSSAISFNVMFLTTVANPDNNGVHGMLGINTYAPSTIGLAQYERLQETVKSINGVLGALVPGYSVEVNDLGPAVLEDGDEGRRVELMSNRDGRRIPFRCESEGVQKITGITSLLIDVYNDSDCCVAIDELDSGVFEFLLGELLEVLASKGKGQLIFTAHNLRALETLPPKCLMFTTSNPKNRFVRFKGVRPSNNLRDLYLRAINLGGQDEEIYAPTDALEIDAAFYRAGHADDISFDELLKQLKS